MHFLYKSVADVHDISMSFIKKYIQTKYYKVDWAEM